MKISGLATYIVGNPWKNWVFVRVETDEGFHGVGEGTVMFFAKTVEAAIHELSPFVIGMDPMEVETISQRLTRDTYADGGHIQMCALAAIEIACWDIIGKVVGRALS